MSYQTNRLLFLVLAGMTLSACGGGGSSNTPAAQLTTPPAPVAATGPVIVKIGPITGFGSVFVDGERFDTADTEVVKDDEISSEDELEIGMIVKVRASSRNERGEWMADDIEFDEEVKGPVDSVGAGSLVVLGQTVNVGSGARFDDGLTLGAIAVGDILELSGYRNELDEINASYVERKNPGDVEAYEVLGQIRDLDEPNQRFRVGGLIVSYASAELDDLDGGLMNGLLVEVQDSNRAYLPNDPVLNATKVEGEDRTEFKDEDDDDDDDADGDHEFEVKGIISGILSDGSFMLGGSIEVRHGSGTEFSGGSAADLAAGVLVEVEGSLAADGALLADEIEFEDNEARISGLVNEVDADNDRIVVMGVTVEVAGAELEDDRDDVEPFTLAELQMNDFVEVEGAERDDVIRASEVERDDADDDSEIRGLLDDFDGTARTVTLFGQLIISGGDTRFEVDDMPVSAEEFFGRLHVSQSVIEAKWDGAQGDTLLPARELSLED